MANALVTATLRGGSGALAVPPLDAELVAYFEGGQRG
jgi:hypothetical protein